MCLIRRALAIAALPLLAGGCAYDIAGEIDDPMSQPATLVPATRTTPALATLPPPARKLDVAVYDFPDLTGQHKSTSGENYASLSRAVTQGGGDILIDVLREAGGGTWFEVVERKRLQPLLQERQIIQKTRQAFQGKKAPGLPALRFAGVLLEGGIVGYDSNETTGGLGARYLGIGGNVKYRRDIVTVALRAVSVQSGRVLASVTTTKTVYSVLVQGLAFKFVSVDELLEVDAGYTKNEPPQLAVREAIELAVYALVLEGVKEGLWGFADPQTGALLLERYEMSRRAPRIAAAGN